MRRRAVAEIEVRGAARREHLAVVWSMLHATYKEIGVKVSSPEELLQDYDVWVIAKGKENRPIGFYLMKTTPFGIKMGLGGSDGSAEGKGHAIRQLRTLFQRPGVYGEVSHKVRDFVLAAGTPVVCVAHVPKVLGKSVTPVSEIDYEREISGVGRVVKTLVGNPRGIPTTEWRRPSCSRQAVEESLREAVQARVVAKLLAHGVRQA